MSTIKADINTVRVETLPTMTELGISVNIRLIIGKTVVGNIYYKNNVLESMNIWVTLPKTVIKAHGLAEESAMWTTTKKPVSFQPAHMYIWYKECERHYYQEMKAYAATMKQYHAKQAAKYQ